MSEDFWLWELEYQAWEESAPYDYETEGDFG